LYCRIRLPYPSAIGQRLAFTLRSMTRRHRAPVTEQEGIMKAAINEVGRVLQKAGPYVVLEVVLPGGTLFALLLYLYRTGQLVRAASLLARGVNRTARALAFALQPAGSQSFARRRDGVELQMLAASR
jgi:hypothetical protein